MMKKKSVSKSGLSNTLASLLDRMYWPFERLPELKLEEYAKACVETTLDYSKEAQVIFAEIILSWELPGCQMFIEDCVRLKQDTRNWLNDRATAVITNKPQPSWPDTWQDVIAGTKDNADLTKLLKYVGYLILVGFNRKVDLDNQTPKIIPRKSPYLAQAIVFYSLSNYLSGKPEKKELGVIADNEFDALAWFHDILAKYPSTKPERKVRPIIIQTLRNKGYKMHHHQTILDGSEMWYRARVLCNTLGEAADYYRIDPSDLSKRIEPYDDATGWPRHR